MDPWLEDPAVFPDLHESLIYLLKSAINAALPKGYVATSKNRVWVDEGRLREPDVSVFSGESASGGGGLATLPDMIAVEEQSDPVEEPYIEILSSQGKRLVTAVEIISLSNKEAGPKGRKTYQAKQQEYRRAGVHLVEIDLLRSGPHVTAISLGRLQEAIGEFDYHYCVRFMGRGTQFFAAPVKLTGPLPRIDIPLSRALPPVVIEMQPLLDRAYDTGRYPDLVDYSDPCEPPLTAEQQAWAEGVLREKRIRN
jgi:hypothetical protein